MSILVIDDHPESGRALAYVIHRAVVAQYSTSDAGAELRPPVIQTVGSLSEAISALLGTSLFGRPTEIFLDLNLDPETEPWEAVKCVRVAAPADCRLFIWSGAQVDEAMLERAWKEGASGWIPKGLGAAEIEEAVHCALRVGFYMPAPATRSGAPASGATAAELTSAERELAVLVGMDLDLQTIANTATGGSLAEASARVAALCGRLGVSTLQSAAERVRTLGLA